MRITNKIMQRNNLLNINTNKLYQDKLSTQMSTQKKISRPSEDPVVALRSLRLRSNVTTVTQYYSKNIPDAESWLDVTESALKNLTGVITNMISQCTKGANGELTTSDRQIILEQMEALADEIYSTGDSDYAGRYVFTGYRTDTSLSFTNEETKNYTITEQLDNTAIDTITKVNTGELLDINADNYNQAPYNTINEGNVSAIEVHRIRLAYNDCQDLETAIPTITYKELDATGNLTDKTLTATMMHSYEDPYTAATKDPDAVIYVPETGEILLGETTYEKLMAAKDDVATVENEGEIRVTYQKDHWQQGDLRPEHYFACITDAGTDDAVEYNSSYLEGEVERQDIEYDVGFNQTIRVNSTADECFQHAIGREVNDMIDSMQEVLDIEDTIADIENLMKTAGEADMKTLQTQLDAANKALTFAKDKCQKLFEQGIDKMQGYLDDANLCITNCGNRSSKLELISSRMQNQKTTFETLKSENEDADITEVAIQLTSTKLTYDAALMATAKVSQTTLLNYI